LSAELQLSRAGSPRCTGYFLTKIFHPNISKTGEICVNTLKKDWRHDLGIGHVLQVRAASLFEPRAQLSSSPRLPPTLTTVRAQVVRCLLINPFPESALNEEAGKLFMEE